jgi:proline iminopeptidase
VVRNSRHGEKQRVRANISTPNHPTQLSGKYDTMDPKHMEWMSKEVQTALSSPNGSHLHNMMIKKSILKA